MKVNQDIDFSSMDSEVSENIEKKENFNQNHDFTSQKVYASKSRKLYFAFLEMELDLTANQMGKNKDGKLIKIINDDCRVQRTHSLPRPLNGHSKVVSNKRFWRYKVDKDLKDSEGKIVVKAGDYHGFVDKDMVKDGQPIIDKNTGEQIGSCLLDKARKRVEQEDKANGTKSDAYRSGTELTTLIYLFKVEQENEETGLVEEVDVNDVCVTAFEMLGLYQPSKKGNYFSFIEGINENPKKNKIINGVWKLSDAGLSYDDKMDSDQLKEVEEKRAKVNEYLNDEKYKKQFPLPYSAFKEAVDNGEYDYSDLSYGKKKEAKPTEEVDINNDDPPF